MNTIPTTFNSKTIPYTIVGGFAAEKKEKAFLSALILCRNGRYNFSSLIKSLINIGCESVLSVEASKKLFDFEKITNEYPSVRFLLPSKETSIGELINIGISEINSEYVLVLWSDQFLLQEAFFKKIFEDIKCKNRICTAPVMINKDNGLLYTQIIPVLKKSRFYTEPNPVIQNRTKTIYPFDFTGIYSCANFIDIGGFDYTIINPYWQNLDFGFRAHLWGYEININSFFKIQYFGAMPAENIFTDDSYGRFYIKNLAPIIKNATAFIKTGIFLSYTKQTGINPLKAFKQIKEGKDWVFVNKERFKKSAYELIANWSPAL